MRFLTYHKNELIVLGLALCLSFILFANGLRGDFVADDKLVILQNPLVSGHLSDLGSIFVSPYYYGQPHAGLYRPLTVVSNNLN